MDFLIGYNYYASGGKFGIWSLDNGELVNTIEESKCYPRMFSPDGEILVGTTSEFGWNTNYSHHSACLWQSSSGALIHIFEENSATQSVAFSPSQKILAGGSGDNLIRLWDIESGELLITLEGHHSNVDTLSFSPDGKTLASGSNE